MRQAGFKPCSALSANLASSSKTRAGDALKRRGQSLDSAKDACKENEFVRAATQAGEAPQSSSLHTRPLRFSCCSSDPVPAAMMTRVARWDLDNPDQQHGYSSQALKCDALSRVCHSKAAKI